jgi:hypothetical protein
MGGQYAPDWTWFIFNRATDCQFGIALMSDYNDGGLSQQFFIGNVVSRIHRSASTNSPDDPWGPSAIFIAGGYHRYVVNNTIYDVDSGINVATPVGSLEIADNIIANVTQPGASHVIIEFSSLASNTSFHHDFLAQNPRVAWADRQVRVTGAQLATVQSLTGDPQFVNPAANDFHILSTSPAAGTAELNPVYALFQSRYGISIATDADGNPRPQLATADMGAYLAATTGGSSSPPAPLPVAPVPGLSESCTANSRPAAPTGLLLVTQGGRSVILAWTKPTGCGGEPTAYVIEAGTATGLSNVGSRTTGDAATKYQGDDLPPGTYYVRVRGQNAFGVGPASNEIRVGGAPGAPQNIRATVSGRTVTLSWDPPTTGGSPSAYILEAGSAPGKSDISRAFVGADVTSKTGPAPPKKLFLRVKAASPSGVSPSSTEVSVTVY